VSLATGRRPSCRCFGSLSQKPIGWHTVAFSGILTGIGFTALVSSTENWSLTIPLASAREVLEAAIVLETAVIVAIGCLGVWLLTNLLRQHGQILLRLEAVEKRELIDLPPRLAPAFSLPTLKGERLELGNLLGIYTSLILIFVDPDCPSCVQLISLLSEWKPRPGTGLIIISRGSHSANQDKFGALSDDYPILLQLDHEVLEEYQIHGTPAAVVVGRDKRIFGPPLLGLVPIRSRLFGLQDSTDIPEDIGVVPPSLYSKIT
jgi:hypothetical protein